MALKKIYLDSRGVNHAESYWRVSTININVVNAKAEIVLLGWRDELARQQKLQPVGGVKLEIEGATFAAYYAQEVAKQKSIAEICYELAKTKPEFTDAVDV